MADLVIQFHALVDELAGFVQSLNEELGVHVTALRFHPFSASQVNASLIESTVRDPKVREIVLTIEPPSVAVSNEADFVVRNPTALHVDIGRLSERGLAESCLSARTIDEKAVAIWKDVARRLRKSTRAGAVASNPATGAKSQLRNHRFTSGAKALGDKGVRILPVAGGALLRLGEP